MSDHEQTPGAVPIIVQVTGAWPNRGHARQVVIEFVDVPERWVRPEGRGANVPPEITAQEARELIMALIMGGMPLATIIALAQEIMDRTVGASVRGRYSD